MANADLDTIIRQLAKQQHKVLTAAIKGRRAHFTALAAKATTADAKARYRQLAADAIEHGTAAAKRMQMSADNTADSYARAMRKAAETPAPAPAATKKAGIKATKPDADPVKPTKMAAKKSGEDSR